MSASQGGGGVFGIAGLIWSISPAQAYLVRGTKQYAYTLGLQRYDAQLAHYLASRPR